MNEPDPKYAAALLEAEQADAFAFLAELQECINDGPELPPDEYVAELRGCVAECVESIERLVLFDRMGYGGMLELCCTYRDASRTICDLLRAMGKLKVATSPVDKLSLS